MDALCAPEQDFAVGVTHVTQAAPTKSSMEKLAKVNYLGNLKSNS